MFIFHNLATRNRKSVNDETETVITNEQPSKLFQFKSGFEFIN